MKKVYVSITGETSVDGNADKTELVTEGEYTFRNGKYLLRYREHLSDVGDDCTTHIKMLY